MVQLQSDDVFVDFGAGLGRAVFAASWLGARRAIGIEVVPHLCQEAAQILLRSRLADRDIEFVCMNAQDYRNSDTSVLFMFHPFGETTLRHVLQNIEDMRMQHAARKTLRIIYIN